MSNQKPEKSLSAYLKGLVDQGAVPDYVAKIINRLPDESQQQEAIKEWKDRLDGPAMKKLWLNWSRKNKGLGGTVDFLLDLNVVHVKDAFIYIGRRSGRLYRQHSQWS